jgi:enediyne biosynthesis protein E3
MTPSEAARTTHAVRPDQPAPGEPPAYEVWRRRLTQTFASLGGVRK